MDPALTKSPVDKLPPSRKKRTYFFVAFFLGDTVPDACCGADADPAGGSSPVKPLQSPDMSCEIISVGFDCIAICFLMRSFSSGSIWSIIFGMINCVNKINVSNRNAWHFTNKFQKKGVQTYHHPGRK
jgi:hypothetical protein